MCKQSAKQKQVSVSPQPHTHPSKYRKLSQIRFFLSMDSQFPFCCKDATFFHWIKSYMCSHSACTGGRNTSGLFIVSIRSIMCSIAISGSDESVRAEFWLENQQIDMQEKKLHTYDIRVLQSVAGRQLHQLRQLIFWHRFMLNIFFGGCSRVLFVPLASFTFKSKRINF